MSPYNQCQFWTLKIRTTNHGGMNITKSGIERGDGGDIDDIAGRYSEGLVGM